ncbi:MAG TPA: MarR family transcriptional regulator [Gaiellaceae bacterium]|nr:MarR family transcriptional regulator [Gaiellaceae bacterium]
MSNDVIKGADAIEIADRLRPVLLTMGRELRREVAPLGVTGGQASLLASIHHRPGIGVRELAELERMSAPGMSANLSRLERMGYVIRTRGAGGDRRRVGLTLSPEGVKMLRKIRSLRTRWLAERLEGLSPDELAAVDAAIEPLGHLLRRAR